MTKQKANTDNKAPEKTSLPTTSQASTTVEALGDFVAFRFFCNFLDGKQSFGAGEVVSMPRADAERYKRNNVGEF